MEGANQPVIGSGGDEYDYIRRVLETPIDPDFWRLESEDNDGWGKSDSAGGSLDQPSFDPFNDGPDVGSVDSSTTFATGSEGSTTKTQERKLKIDISSDDVLAFSELSRREAASKLKVSESTLKRVCRKYGIHRWPPRGIHKEEERFPVAEPSAGDILPLDSPEESLLMEPDSTINVAYDVRENYSWPSISHLENGSLLTLENPQQQFGRRREYAAKSLGVSTSTMRCMCRPHGFTRRPYQQNGGGAVARGKSGVKIELPLEDVLRYSDMKLANAARKLKVCSATLTHICRDYGIRRWPPRN